MIIANHTLLIDQVHGRPVAVSVSPPGLILIVQGYRIRHIQAYQRLTYDRTEEIIRALLVEDL